MLYIKNSGTYALKFSTEINGVEKKFVFDCLRIYSDTGNLASTGITPISEGDYEALYTGHKFFKTLCDKGTLSKSATDGATTVASRVDLLAKENAALKRELDKKVKEASTAVNSEVEKMKNENASLKKQLEAMKKTKKKDVDETSDF